MRLANNAFVVAYFSAVPLATFRTSGQLIAAVFFKAVYGEYAGGRILPVFVALSSVSWTLLISLQLTDRWSSLETFFL